MPTVDLWTVPCVYYYSSGRKKSHEYATTYESKQLHDASQALPCLVCHFVKMTTVLTLIQMSLQGRSLSLGEKILRLIC